MTSRLVPLHHTQCNSPFWICSLFLYFHLNERQKAFRYRFSKECVIIWILISILVKHFVFNLMVTLFETFHFFIIIIIIYFFKEAIWLLLCLSSVFLTHFLKPHVLSPFWVFALFLVLSLSFFSVSVIRVCYLIVIHTVGFSAAGQFVLSVMAAYCNQRNLWNTWFWLVSFISVGSTS